MIQRTLVLLKPDAVRRGLVGHILARFEAKGLTIVTMEQRTIDGAKADEQCRTVGEGGVDPEREPGPGDDDRHHAGDPRRQDAEDASAIVVSGSRIRVGNVEAKGQFRLGVVAPPPPPAPSPVPGSWGPPYHDEGRDKFTKFAENAFKIVREAPVSTFSIDVDTASYSWVRASLNNNVMPQPASVRTEEMVNYFSYDYAPPKTTALPSPMKRSQRRTKFAVCRQ